MPSPITRRQAIKMIALSGVAVGLGIEELRHLTETEPRLTRVHETRILMGMLATLTTLADRSDAAHAAIHAAFERMARLEQVFSRFSATSQLSILNRTGSLTGASPDFVRVMSQAMDFSEMTGGAFDVTVEPLLKAYRVSARQGMLPHQRTVDSLKALVDFRQVKRSGDTIDLRRSGMAVTFDGLAKGYILDAGADELLRHGCANVLVEAGGDLIARGMTGSGGWRIGIQSSRAQAAGELLGAVNVENAAVATSGDYLNRFTADGAQHHILDPDTGMSPSALSSVTVLAPTACQADALSTSLMVLEPTTGFSLIRQRPDVQALVVDKSGAHVRLNDFPLLVR